jgi:hypothetical protein
VRKENPVLLRFLPRVVVSAILLVLLIASCNSTRSGNLDTKDIANLVFRRSLEVAEEFAYPKRDLHDSDFARFDAAISTLEQLTGIYSGTDSALGRFPTNRLKEAIPEWRAWHDRYGHCLDFDPVLCKVTLIKQPTCIASRTDSNAAGP